MADFDFTTDSFEEEEPQAEIGTGFGGANVAPAEKLSDTDQFLRDSGIAEENRAELAGDDPELDPADKELVLNNPAHFMEEGEDRDQADAEWKGVEDKVQEGGWDKAVQELRTAVDESDATTLAGMQVKLGAAVVGSVIDSVEDIGNTAILGYNKITEWMKENDYTEEDFRIDEKLDFAEKVWPQSDNVGQNMARGMAGYMLPYMGAAKVLRGASAITTAAKATTFGAGLAFVKQDPEGELVSDMIQSVPWMQNPVTAFLATEEGDGALTIKGKAALESVLIDSLMFGLPVAKQLAPEAGAAFDAARESTRKLVSPFVDTLDGFKKSWKHTKMAKKIIEKAKVVEDTFDGSAYKELSMSGELHVKGSKHTTMNMANMGSRPGGAGGSEDDFLTGIAKRLKQLPLVKERLRTSERKTLRAALKQIQTEDPILTLKRVANGEYAEGDVAVMKVLHEQLIASQKVAADAAQLTGSAADIAHFAEMRGAVKWADAASNRVASDAGALLKMEQYNLFASNAKDKKGYIAQMLVNGDEKTILEEIKLISELGDLPDVQFYEQMGKYHRMTRWKKVGNAIMELRTNNMLAGTAQTTSLGAAFARAIPDMYELGVGALYTTVRGSRKGGNIYWGELPRYAKGYRGEGATQVLSAYGAIIDSHKFLGEYAKNGRHAWLAGPLSKSLKVLPEVLPKGGKVLAAQAKTAHSSVQLQDFRGANNMRTPGIASGMIFDKPNPKALSASGVIDVVGSTVRLPSLGLTTGDKMTGMMHYRANVEHLAYRKARDLGLKGADLEDYITNVSNGNIQMLDTDLQEAASKIGQGAELKADQARFLSPLTGNYEKIHQSIQAHALTKFMFPFSRVGLNILSQATERLPGLALSHNQYISAMEKGGSAAVEAKAKVYAGASVLATLGAMGYAGKITGGPPRNQTMRDFYKANGITENSVMVNGYYVDASKFGEPYSTIIKAGVDLAHIAGYALSEDATPEMKQNYESLVGLAIAVIADTASPDFLHEGLSEIIRGMETRSAEENVDFAQQSIFKNAVVGTVIPQFIRQARKMTDPTKRYVMPDETKDNWKTFARIKNELMNAIPGLSEFLPPQRNIFGDAVQYPIGIGPDIISPIYATKFKDDKVINELIRLGVAGPLADPVRPKGEEHLQFQKPSRKWQGVQLSHDQYDDLMVFMSNKNFDIPGTLGRRTLKEALGDTMDMGKGVVGDELLKNQLVNKYNAYRSAAMGQLIKKYPGLVDEVKDLAESKGEAYKALPSGGQ